MMSTETTLTRTKRMYPDGGIKAGAAKEFVIVPTAGDLKRESIAKGGISPDARHALAPSVVWDGPELCP